MLIWIMRTITSVLVAVCASYFVWQLQLSGYFWRRSIKNLVLNFFWLICCILSLVQTIFYICLPSVAIYTNAVSFVLLIPFVFVKKKVSLKLTKRVLRWLATTLLIYFAIDICCTGYISPIFLLPIILIADIVLFPLNSLINLYYIKKAQKKLTQMDCITILVTGSYGKTSVKNILQRFLSTKYKTECSPGSFNTPLGLAKFINSCDKSDILLVLEAGAKKVGDIAKICRLFRPRHAIITGVTSQHLSTFNTLQNIIETKGEVLDSLSYGGFCVVNADDKNSTSYFCKGDSVKLSVGFNGADIAIMDVNISLNGTSFCLKEGDKVYKIFTPLLGKINAQNIAMAFCLALKLNCDADALIREAATLPYNKHRLELIPVKNRFVLDDSYNANEEGVKGLLEVLAAFNGNKVVVTQGIVELGVISHSINYNLGVNLGKICTAMAVLGQNSLSLYLGAADGGLPSNKLFFADDLNDAVKKLSPYLNDGSVIAFQNDLPDNMKN